VETCVKFTYNLNSVFYSEVLISHTLNWSVKKFLSIYLNRLSTTNAIWNINFNIFPHLKVKFYESKIIDLIRNIRINIVRMHKIKSGKQKFFSMHFQAGKDQTFFHTFPNSVQRSCKDTYRALPSPLRNSENITFPNSFVSTRKGSFNKLSPVVSAFLPPFQWNTSGNIWFPHNSCSPVWNRNSMFRGDTVSRCFKTTFVNLKYIYICIMWEGW